MEASTNMTGNHQPTKKFSFLLIQVDMQASTFTCFSTQVPKSK